MAQANHPEQSPEQSPENSKAARDKLCALIEEIGIAMVTTMETDGSLRARPMAAQFAGEDRDRLYFLTARSSAKTEEMAREPNVNLSFAKGGDYVSVSGVARIRRDPALIDALWSEAARPWFPKGRRDPDICAVEVDLHYGEYWDPPGAAVTLAYGWTKAMLTGRDAHGDLGDSAKIGHPG